MIHGVVHFWITPHPKKRGKLVNGSHWKKDMVEILEKIIRF
jgi:hypothetical protein